MSHTAIGLLAVTGVLVMAAGLVRAGGRRLYVVVPGGFLLAMFAVIAILLGLLS